MTEIKIKRSAVPTKVPTTTDLSLGELALNTYDGKQYFKKDNGSQSIIRTLDSQDLDTDNTLAANSDLKVSTQKAVKSALDTKVDKITGKGLSTNDYTNTEKTNAEITHDIINYIAMTGVYDGGDITLTGGINFNIAAGSGYIRDPSNNIVALSWTGISSTIPVAGDNFIYIDYTGAIVFRTIKNDDDNIFIGYISTNDTNTTILGFNSNKFLYNQYLPRLNKFIEKAIGTMIEYGFELSINSFPDTLRVTTTAGALWQDFNEFIVGSKTNFRKFYRDNMSVDYEDTSTPNYINNTQYNDLSLLGTNAIVPMTTGYYKKDLFFVTTRGMLYYQHGTSQYAELEHAYSAEPPTVNPASTNIVVIAHIIIQEGNDVPIAIIDMRPSFERLWNGHYFKDLIPTIEHHSIQGLDEDDHIQYLNTTRGDVRYYNKTLLDGGQLDTRYYTESEVDGFISSKANSSHTHLAADITDLSKSSVGLSNVVNVDQQDAANITYGTLSNSRLSTNLTQIGNATFVDDDFVVKSSGVMTNKSVSQVKTLLAINNIDNTSDANKPISTTTQTALNDKVDKITGKSLSTNDFTNTYKSEVDSFVYSLNELGSSVNVSGGVVTLTGGITFSISSGVGYTRDNTGKMIRVVWSTLSGNSCTNDGDNFINIDYQGNVVITTGAAQGDLIALGYIRTSFANTTIVGFSNTRLKGYNFTFNMGELFRTSIGSLIQSGCNTAMQSSPNQLKLTVSSGFIWSLFNRFTIADTSTFTKLFNSSDYGFVPDTATTANTVITTLWNNSSLVAASALVTMTTGYYKKDLIALTPEGTIFYVYANTEWATIDEARTAATPPVPESIKLSIVRSAAIISLCGATSIAELIDIRPMISRLFDTGQAATNATVISHSNLTDLGNDDHIQYLNTTRGDGRYYRKSELDSGSLDTRYYTESEITSFLSGKANSSHTHLAADITDLSKSSVGLSNVVNVDQTNASNITSGTLSSSRLATNLSEIAGLTKTEGDLIAVVGGVFAAQPVAGRRVVLGIDQVQNVDQTNASNITSGTLANARLTSNLSQIGDLTLSTGDYFQFNGTVVTNVTPTALKTSLSLVKGDVGLGNVQNVDQTNASNITSGTLANARLTSNLSQIGGLTLSTGDFLQFNGAVITNVTPSGLKISLSLVKGDVGLGNVQNVDQTNASNITSGTLANIRLTNNLSQIGGITFATNDIIQYNGTALINVTPSSYKTSLSLVKGDVGLANVVNLDTSTTANITDSTNKRFVNDAQATVIGNTSNTNTGDETQATIKTKLGAATTLVDGYLSSTNWNTFNNKEPSITAGTTGQYYRGDKSFQTLDKTSVGLANVVNLDTSNASNISSGTLANARLTTNLTQLGGITFATNDYIQYNGTTLIKVTPTSVKTSLSLVKGDVGLGNVANVDTSNASNISTGTLANARLTTNLTQLGGITFTTNDFIQYNGTSLINVNPTTVKTSIGLGNVVNLDTSNASNISTGTLANARLTTNLTQLGGITFATNDIVQYNGTSLIDVSVVGLNSNTIVTHTGTSIQIDSPYSKTPFGTHTGFFEDFISTTISPFTSYMTSVVSGTGAANSVTTTPTFGGTDQRIGILQHSTGTTATGGALLYGGSTGALFNLGNLAVDQSVEVAASVRLPVLSTGTQRYTFYFGIMDMTTTAEAVDGVYFRYNDSLSTEFQYVTSTNSTRVATASLTTVVANTDYNLRVKVTNIAGTLTAFWYIDGVQVGTTTSGLPIATGRDTSIGIALVKSVGTTARTAQADWIWFDYTTTRSTSI